MTRAWRRELAAVLTCGIILSAPVLAAAPGERAVQVDVDKDGLKWSGPCKAVFFYAAERDESLAVALVHSDVSEPASLAPGKYELQVECPSTEGVLKQTESLVVGARDVTVAMRLRPAFVLVRVLRDGKEVPAQIEISDAFGRVVQSGRDKVVLPVPPGKLRILARVDREAAGTSRPILGALDMVTRAGHKETPLIDTSDGSLVLVITNNGRPAEGVGALRAPGGLARLVELNTGAPQPVPPGTYDVVAQLSESHDFKEMLQRNVRIQPGRTVTVRIAHKTGRLEPRLVMSGAPVPEGASVDVQLFLGSAPQAFNTLAPDEAAVLAPGRYRVLARFLERTLDDGSPWQADGEAQVSAGRITKIALDLSPPTLALVTRIGATPRPLDVAVYRQGAEAPIVTRRSSDEGTLSLRLVPGSYRVVAKWKAPQGELATEERVFLKAHQSAERSLDLNVGVAVVQVFENSIAVPAEVLFFAEGAAAPLLSVPAGQDAYLPPGAYALSVRRKGKERRFSPVRIAAGRTVERQLELTSTDESGAPRPQGDASNQGASSESRSEPPSVPPDGDEDMP